MLGVSDRDVFGPMPLHLELGGALVSYVPMKTSVLGIADGGIAS